MALEEPMKCDACGYNFQAISGNTFLNLLFRCSKCGKKKWVPRDGVIPFEIKVKARTEISPFHCRCGGTFTDNAPIRCPKCKSTKLELTDGIMRHID